VVTEIFAMTANATIFDDAAEVVRGFRNGVTYGMKIRFPHSCVMEYLYGTSYEKSARSIFNKTKSHALRLGSFVACFKLVMIIQRRLQGGEETRLHHFIAGLVGGGIVFGDKTSVVHQINLYVFARVMMGFIRMIAELAKRTATHTKPTVKLAPNSYKMFGALTWGLVMYLFEYKEHYISRSMASSMHFLYHNPKPFPENQKMLKEFFFH